MTKDTKGNNKTLSEMDYDELNQAMGDLYSKEGTLSKEEFKIQRKAIMAAMDELSEREKEVSLTSSPMQLATPSPVQLPSSPAAASSSLSITPTIRLQRAIAEANIASPDILGIGILKALSDFIKDLNEKKDLPQNYHHEASAYAQAIEDGVAAFKERVSANLQKNPEIGVDGIKEFYAREVNELLTSYINKIETAYMRHRGSDKMFAGFEHVGFSQFASQLKESIDRANKTNPGILGEGISKKMANLVMTLREGEMPDYYCDMAMLCTNAINKALKDFPDIRAANTFLTTELARIEQTFHPLQVNDRFNNAVSEVVGFINPDEKSIAKEYADDVIRKLQKYNYKETDAKEIVSGILERAADKLHDGIDPKVVNMDTNKEIEKLLHRAKSLHTSRSSEGRSI